MPVLRNTKHETFCVGIVRGLTPPAAYKKAGYRCAHDEVARNAGNRLARRTDIKERINELGGRKKDNRIAVEQVALARKSGRPTLYRPEIAEHVRRLALLGLTDPEMADAINVDAYTFSNWKVEHPELNKAIERGGILADAKVAERTYHRALGYHHPAEKIFYDSKEGVIRAAYTEHYPPDMQAARLWLGNRQRARWPGTERVDVNVKSDLTQRLNQMSLEERGALALELAARIRQRLADAGLDEDGEPIVVIEYEPVEAEDPVRAEPEATPPVRPVHTPRARVASVTPPSQGVTPSRGQATGRWREKADSQPALPIEDIDAKAVAPADVVHAPVHAEPEETPPGAVHAGDSAAARRAYKAKWERQRRARQKAAGRPGTGSVADPAKSPEPALAGGRHVAPGPRS